MAVIRYLGSLSLIGLLAILSCRDAGEAIPLAASPTAATPVPVPEPPIEEPTNSRDQHGDPLPEGAVARMGTLRFHHVYAASAMVLAPDGTWLVSASDRAVRLWSFPEGRLLRRLEDHKGPLRALAVSPDGRLVASAGSYRTILVRSVASGDVIHRLEGTTGSVRSVSFSPDGKRLAAGGATESLVCIWKLGTDEAPLKIPARFPNLDVRFDADSASLLAIHQNGSVEKWDVATGNPMRVKVRLAMSAFSCAFHAGRNLAAVGDARGNLKIVKLEDGEEVQNLVVGETPVHSIAFSPDAKRIATSGREGIQVWDIASGKSLFSVAIGVWPVESLLYTADGAMLLSGEYGRIRCWSAEDGHPVSDRDSHDSLISSVAFSPDGRHIVTAGGRSVRMWETSTGRQIARVDAKDGLFMTVAFSRSGDRVAAAGSFKGVLLLRAPALTEEKRFEGGAVSLAFSADGRMLATADSAGTLTVRNVETGATRQLWNQPGGADLAVDISPDGVWIAARHARGITLRDVATGREAWGAADTRGQAKAIAFSSDGKRLACADSGGIRILESATGRVIKVMQDEKRGGRTVAFSPDDSMLVTGYDDRVVRLWDTATGSQIAAIEGHDGAVMSVAFSSDGRFVASGSTDRTALIWDVSAVENPSDARWAALCSDLGRGDHSIAVLRARKTFLKAGDRGIPILRQGLTISVSARARAAQLVAELDDEHPARREAAAKELGTCGIAAAAVLREAADESGSPERSARAAEILGRLEGAKVLPPDCVRRDRIVRLLGEIATPQAIAILKVLASESPLKRERADAEGAIRRSGR